MPLVCKLTTWQSCFLFLASAPPEAIFLCLIILGLDTRQQKTISIAQSPPKLLKLTEAKLFTFPSFAFSMEIPRNSTTYTFLSLRSSASWSPWCFPLWSHMVCLLLLEWVNIINFIFPEHILYLLPWLHLSDCLINKMQNKKPNQETKDLHTLKQCWMKLKKT